MADYKYVHVIANPAAGQDTPILSTLNRVFQQHETPWQIDVTHHKGDGARLAQKALEAGADLIVAYGGDGTMGDVAGGMLNSKVPLAIAPGGTANALAVGLGVSQNLETALQQIFTSTPHPLDLGRANEELFILRATMGLSIETSADRGAKDRLGLLAYVTASIEALGNPPQITFSLDIDGEQITTEGIGCIITNHNELGALGLNFGPDVNPGDGLLDVFIISTVTEALSAVASGLIRLSDNATTGMQHWQCQKISIHTDTPQMLGLDGDIVGETPVQVEVLPGAIQVLIPNAPAE